MADPETRTQNLILAQANIARLLEGAANLKKLAEKLDTGKMNSPSFLMVLTGVGQYAYRRPQDGILVVPIGSLRN